MYNLTMIKTQSMKSMKKKSSVFSQTEFQCFLFYSINSKVPQDAHTQQAKINKSSKQNTNTTITWIHDEITKTVLPNKENCIDTKSTAIFQ